MSTSIDRFEPMSKHERMSFRLFCERATDKQLAVIVTKETLAGTVSLYRKRCAGIAKRVQRERDMYGMTGAPCVG